MGTTSNAISGTSSSNIFNGTSRYSQDFQNVIARATAIASLPIQQLTNQKTTLGEQTTALTGLGTKFTALQSAVQSIQSAVGGSSFDATVSDPTKLTVSLGDGAMEGNYSIDVVDAGAYATSMTTSSWVSTGSHTYQLSLDGGTTKYSITPADNSAASVAAAINASYSDKVRAIVVNVGSSSTPDYRISLQDVALGTMTPDILDGGSSLQTQQTVGAQAQYIVNNSGITVTSSSRTVSIANGLTVNLLAKDLGTPVNITVTRSTSALSDALSAFVSAYNAAVDEVDKQRGTTAGPLAGDTVVSDLAQALSGIATYTSSGSAINSLASLGVTLDDTGHMTFNPFSLIGADLNNSSAVAAFLGSSTTSGFLKTATDTLNSVNDSSTGTLATAETSVTNQTTDLTNRIADEQARVDTMTQQMTDQLAKADALIATMEQQYNYLSGMFQAMQTADQAYK